MGRRNYIKYILKYFGIYAFTIGELSAFIINEDPYIKKSSIRNGIHRLYQDEILCKPSRGIYCLAIGDSVSKADPVINSASLPKPTNILKKLHAKYPTLPSEKKSYAIFVLPDNYHVLYINSALSNEKTPINILYGGNTYEVAIINPTIKIDNNNLVAVSLVELSNYITQKGIQIDPNQFLNCFCTFWGEKRRIRKSGNAFQKYRLIKYLTEQSSTLKEHAKKKALEEEKKYLYKEKMLEEKCPNTKEIIEKEITSIKIPYDVFFHHYYDFLALHDVIKSYYRAAKDKKYFEIYITNSYLSKLYPSKYLDPNYKPEEVTNPDTHTYDKPYMFHRDRRM